MCVLCVWSNTRIKMLHRISLSVEYSSRYCFVYTYSHSAWSGINSKHRNHNIYSISFFFLFCSRIGKKHRNHIRTFQFLFAKEKFLLFLHWRKVVVTVLYMEYLRQETTTKKKTNKNNKKSIYQSHGCIIIAHHSLLVLVFPLLVRLFLFLYYCPSSRSRVPALTLTMNDWTDEACHFVIVWFVFPFLSLVLSYYLPTFPMHRGPSFICSVLGCACCLASMTTTDTTHLTETITEPKALHSSSIIVYYARSRTFFFVVRRTTHRTILVYHEHELTN